MELAVVFGKTGKDIQRSEANQYIGGYGAYNNHGFFVHSVMSISLVSLTKVALAVDMTARNMQDKAKKSGLPWSAAKGFDTFTPISSMISKDQIPDPHNVDLWLTVDNKMRQRGNTSDMIFSIPELIAYVSSIMTLEAGDVMLTGTPKGVSQLQHGQVVHAGLQLPDVPNTLAELKLLVQNRVGGYAFKP